MSNASVWAVDTDIDQKTQGWLDWDRTVQATAERAQQYEKSNEAMGHRIAQRIREGYTEHKLSQAYTDPANIEASRILYESNVGQPFEGTDEEVVDYGINQMRDFAYSAFQVDPILTTAPWDMPDQWWKAETWESIPQPGSLAEYLTSMYDRPDHVQAAFMHMVNEFDAIDAPNGPEVWEFAKRLVKDPSALASVGAYPAIRQGLMKLAGTKLMNLPGMNRVATTVAAMVEGGALASGFDIGMQQTLIDASIDNPYHQQQTEIDHDRANMAAGFGAAFGGALVNAPAAASALTRKASAATKEGPSLADYFKRNIAGQPKGAEVPDATFTVGEVAGDLGADLAHHMPGAREVMELRINGRALKHFYERRPDAAEQYVKNPAAFLKGAESLPNPKSGVDWQRPWLVVTSPVGPGNPKRFVATVVEIVEVDGHLEVVTIIDPVSQKDIQKLRKKKASLGDREAGKL